MFEKVFFLLCFLFEVLIFFVCICACFFSGADKDRELGEAQAEIKALRLSERLREKAVEEVSNLCFFQKNYILKVFNFVCFVIFFIGIYTLN